jgi:hypothetical protein
MKRPYLLMSFVLLLASAMPGLVSADEVDARLDKLRTYLKACTQEHGYDPDRARNYGEHEIAAGEMKWRECAYDGVRKIMVPESSVPNSYQTLISLDRVMTKEIRNDNRTREQRRTRITQMLDHILAQEKSKLSSAGDARKEQEDLVKTRNELTARLRELEKMRRIESMMR